MAPRLYHVICGIAARTHPFMIHLVKQHGAEICDQLHLPTTAKRITIATGCVIKASVIDGS